MNTYLAMILLAVAHAASTEAGAQPLQQPGPVLAGASAQSVPSAQATDEAPARKFRRGHGIERREGYKEAPPRERRTCQQADADALVGKPVADAKAQARTSGLRVRVLKPGQPSTMEFLEYRVQLIVDDEGLVTSAHCG